jgi:hypothetical protein
MQYMLVATNRDPLRPLVPHVVATSRMEDACISLFKNTPEEVAARMESYVTARIPGKLPSLASQ